MKIYIEITELLKQDFLSGIQRTVIEYTLRLLKKKEFEICLFSCTADGKKLRAVSSEAFEAYYTYRSINKQKCITGKTFNIRDMQQGEIYLELDATWGAPIPRSVFLQTLKQRGVIIVSYIYDIIAITASQYMFPDLIRAFIPYAIAHLSYSDLILCSTQFTIDQIKELSNQYGIPHNRYGVVPLGSDFQVNPKTATIKPQREAIAITNSGRKYILTVGTLEPRKNHKILLDAYDHGLGELGVQLVFVGRRGWNVDDLISRIHNHPEYGKNIFHLEGMNDASVAWLYDHAFLSAFPTFIEGFGIPVVEALEHHVPTIVSDVPVMHEVGHEYCDYFAPDDPDAFVKIVKKYFDDGELYAARKELIHAFQPTTWGSAVDLLCGYLKQAEERGSQSAAACQINTSFITEQVLRDAGKQLCFNDIPEMTDFGLDNGIAYLKGQEIRFYRDLSSYHKWIEKPVIFIKRVIRKLVRFLLEPIVGEINSYNHCLMSILDEQQKVNCVVFELKEQVERLTYENLQLKKMLNQSSGKRGGNMG